MLLEILHIEATGVDGRSRRLVISGSDEPRKTSAAVVKSLGLEEGTRHDAKTFWRSLEATEKACAKERAMSIIGYRERSTRELERRLIADGYPPGLSRSVVARCIELGLVDDERFASMWARSRAASGMGPNRVRRELESKGVPPVLIAEALSEAFDQLDIVTRARDSLRGRRPETKKERDKLIRRLVGRGYSLSTALAALHADDED